MPYTDSIEEHGAVASLLSANRERRERAAVELDAARDELRGLLFRGQKARMEVADMSFQAGMSRDTAHAILKEGGIMSWKQKQAWAATVMELVPRGDFAQNEFRMFVQMDLYRALGSNPGDLPRSLAGVLDAATQTMRTVAGKPDFVPVIDAAQLGALEWPKEPFEIYQRGLGTRATFQVRQGGVKVGPWRSSAEGIARDLRAAGGERPAFIDRTGPECVTRDGRRIGWDVLRDLE
jgi:hypothetical protein